MRGFMASRCLLTALELDVFTAVDRGATARQVAEELDADTRAVGMLLNALVALGLLSKDDDEYRNTPQSARYFVRDSSDNQRDHLLHVVGLWHTWSNLSVSVRRGKCVPVEYYNSHDWPRNFIVAMHSYAEDCAASLLNILGTEGVCSVLDLGGGSGAYSIAFAKAAPHVRCDILDLPEVLPLTSGYVGKAGVSRQIRLRAGDMLHDDFGSGYDLVMLNAVCHMFSERQNQELFRRVRQALVPNGRLAVQDFILNSEKTGPLQAALFSLNMLVGTPAGACYNEAEYMAWMRAAGFAEVRRVPLQGTSDLIVGVAK
ncbi:MAG: methyltransferase [Acidobacteriaceae bacterium]|nr:methyltransferase [Acidobacteriaceae bacterium]